MSAESPALEDEAIVDLVLAGDADAYEGLVSRHRDQVFRIVGRHVPTDQVADVAHETFVQAFLSLRARSPRAPFAHWLARIAVRAGCDYWRQTYRHRARTASTSDRPAREPSEHADPLIDDRELLQWALDQLDIDDRLAVTVLHLEEQSVKEAAAILRWSPSRVKVRAHRARKRLRAILQRAPVEGADPHA